MANQPHRHARIGIHGFPGLNLAVLGPAEVISLDEYLTTPDDELIDLSLLDAAEQSMRHALGRTISNVLEGVPRKDPVYGRLLCEAYAECPDFATRSSTGRMVIELTRVDTRSGLPLWDTLVRDEHDEVRYLAYEPLVGPLRSLLKEPGSRGEAHQKFADLGITWRDGLHLQEAYVAAEHGEDLVRVPYPEGYEYHSYLTHLQVLGRTAFVKLVSMTNPDQE